MYVDLHLHTIHSDGKLQVKDTIDIASEKGIKLLSITDHDSVAGVQEAIEYSKSHGISCISGVELSCRNEMSILEFPQDVSIHILAYNIDYNCIELIDTFQRYHSVRKSILDGLIKELCSDDFDINYDDINIIAGKQMRIQDVINHINSCFMCNEKKKRYIEIAKSCYQKLFSQDNPLQNAINLIKASGGLSVLAHAFISYRDYDVEQNSFENVLNLLNYLCDMGLDGIEAFYPKHSNEQCIFLQEEAKKRNLFVTAGSDFHGTPLRKGMMDYEIKQMDKTVSLFKNINRY